MKRFIIAICLLLTTVVSSFGKTPIRDESSLPGVYGFYAAPWTKWAFIGWEWTTIKDGVFTKNFNGYKAPTTFSSGCWYIAGIYFNMGVHEYIHTPYNVLGYNVCVSTDCDKYGVSLGEILFPLPKPLYIGRFGVTIVYSSITTDLYDTSHNNIGWDRGYPDFREDASCWGIRFEISASFMSFAFETSKNQTTFGFLLGF